MYVSRDSHTLRKAVVTEDVATKRIQWLTDNSKTNSALELLDAEDSQWGE